MSFWETESFSGNPDINSLDQKGPLRGIFVCTG